MGIEEQRAEIARRYGFPSYAALLDVSELLPVSPEDTVRTYLARRGDGRWFLWEDYTQALPPPEEP